MHVVRLAAWLIAIVYSTIPALWLLVHPRARQFGRVKAPLTLVGPGWFTLWLLMAAITFPWRHLLAYETPWAWLPAAPFFIGGAYLYRASLRDFTLDQALGRPELHPHRHGQHLVTSGIRQHVRHPIYLAHLVELLGWSICTGLVVVYAMTALAVITGIVMIRAEERELEMRFGESYRLYRDQVPAILPRVTRR